MTAAAWIVGQDRCRTGKGLFDVDRLTLTQMDIVGVVFELHLLQGHFRADKVLHINAVFDAFDRAADELDIAEIAGNINGSTGCIRVGHRTVGHAQRATVTNGAFCIRGNGAAVDLHTTPVVLDAACPLRFQSAIIDCYRSIVNNAALVCRFIVSAVDFNNCTGIIFNDSTRLAVDGNLRCNRNICQRQVSLVFELTIER